MEVVARLKLTPEVRVERYSVYTACRIGNRPDPEVFAFYSFGPSDSAEVHPYFAWRARRTARRFETVQPRSVVCEPDAEGDDGDG